MEVFDRNSLFFTAFRTDFGFPYFHRHEPLYLFREIGLWGVGMAYIVVILSLTVLITFLGTRGYSRWRVALQMTISLVIGVPIVLCATGQSWQKAEYELMDGANHKNHYGLYIGLGQANITMTTYDRSHDEWMEVAYYNEKIQWTEVDQAEREYKEALLQGWPWEILRIARYVSIDMGGLRFMRQFRKSGYAVYITLWSAFATWVLANILFSSAISYGGLLLLLTGCLQIVACIVYDTQQPEGFYIPLDQSTTEISGGKLRLMYYWMYWLTLFVGIFAVLLSFIIMVLNYLKPEDMNKFFGTVSEYHSPYEELEENQNKSVLKLTSKLSRKVSRMASRKGPKEPSAAGADVKQRFASNAGFSSSGYGATDKTRADKHDSLEVPGEDNSRQGVPQVSVTRTEVQETSLIDNPEPEAHLESRTGSDEKLVDDTSSSSDVDNTAGGGSENPAFIQQ